VLSAGVVLSAASSVCRAALSFLPVERICPFLALEGDVRTVVAAVDPGHRCGAVRPPQPLAREVQLSTCLVGEHRSCPRYVAATEAAGRQVTGWPAPAIDAQLISTRLVLSPDAATRRPRSGRSPAPTAARWALGAAAATVGVATVVGGVSGALGLPGFGVAGPSESGASGAASPPVSQPPAASQPAIGGPSPRPPAPTLSPTPSGSPASATPRPTRRPAAPTPTPAPQRTYVVRPGDTLGDIAARFGTTVAALQSANGLADSDVILIGQVLVIP
jgi:hypothetical protein